MVYLIECDAGGPVKIGRAGDPLRRLADLQGANPHELRLLAVIDSDDDATLEAMLHRTFAESRIRREWFARTPALEALIAEAAGETPLPGSFEALCRQDDRLARLATEATELAGRPCRLFCRDFVFHRQFAPRLERLVGWGARRGPLRTRAEHQVASEGILAALPACFGCEHHVRVSF